jgi:outer membrane protein insertion porin family/translocation and assembly module TamA
VVRRAVGIRAGQPFSRKALYDTQRNLYRTDLFTYVSVGLVDSLRTSPDDSLVAIKVQVNEGKLNVVRAGAGYGALDCFRGLTGWTGRNFFGGGRSLDLSGRLSKVGATPGVLCPGLNEEDDTRRRLNYDLTLSLREPFLFTRQTTGSVSLFTERHSEIKAFTRIATGGEISVTQLVTPTFPLVFTYALSRGQTIADPAIFCTFLNVCLENDIVFSNRQWASTLGAGVLLSRVNSVLDPTRGSSSAIQLRYSSPAIGSDPQRQFAKGVFEFASYQPMGAEGVFAWRVRLGALLPTQLQLLDSAQRFAPPDERFYLGGPNTVRGYTQNELGPLVRVVTGYPLLRDSAGKVKKDPTGKIELQDSTQRPLTRTSPTGGDVLVLANAELRFPIFGRLRGAIFVDVGEIYGGEPKGEEALHATPGVGLRFTTPIGPIRIDVGYNPQTPAAGPLYRVEGAELKLIDPLFQEPEPRFIDHLRFHFSVGQPF